VTKEIYSWEEVRRTKSKKMRAQGFLVLLLAAFYTQGKTLKKYSFKMLEVFMQHFYQIINHKFSGTTFLYFTLKKYT